MENNQKKKWFNVFDFVYYKGERLSRKGWRCGGEMLFIFMWITVSFAAGNISRLQILHTDYALYGGPVVIFLLCYLRYYRTDKYDELHKQYQSHILNEIPEELILIVVFAIMAITVYQSVS